MDYFSHIPLYQPTTGYSRLNVEAYAMKRIIALHLSDFCLIPLYLVRLAGFEPAANGFEDHCSIQLSYRRIG